MLVFKRQWISEQWISRTKRFKRFYYYLLHWHLHSQPDTPQFSIHYLNKCKSSPTINLQLSIILRKTLETSPTGYYTRISTKHHSTLKLCSLIASRRPTLLALRASSWKIQNNPRLSARRRRGPNPRHNKYIYPVAGARQHSLRISRGLKAPSDCRYIARRVYYSSDGRTLTKWLWREERERGESNPGRQRRTCVSV